MCCIDWGEALLEEKKKGNVPYRVGSLGAKEAGKLDQSTWA